MKKLLISLFLVVCFMGSAFAGSGANLQEAACARKYGTDTYIISQLITQREMGVKEIESTVSWDLVPKEEVQWLHDLIARGVEWHEKNPDKASFEWYREEIKNCIANEKLSFLKTASNGNIKSRTIMEITKEDYSKKEQCEFFAMEYTIGFMGFYEERPMVMKHIDKKLGYEMIDRGIPPPLDGFYVLDWNKYTKEEQDWIFNMIKEGYEHASRFFIEYPDIKPVYYTILSARYEFCMSQEEL